jgi:hypothetical protein
MRPIFLFGSMALMGALSAPGQETNLEPVPPAERLVGIAYSPWFPPTNWIDVWDTPELGPYNSSDPAIIRQHAEWLTDAGVDFIWVDWSNNTDYDPSLEGQPDIIRDGKVYLRHRQDIKAIEDATTAVFDEFAILEERPRISIFLGAQPAETATDGRLQRKADQVYDAYISNPKYRGLHQEYLGKPLLVVYVGTPSPWQSGTPKWDDPRFTVRWMTGFVTEQSNLRTPDLVSKHGYWSWEDRGPQTYTIHEGKPESMVVVAGWRPQAEPGQPGYIPAGGRREGQTFRDQWARAREIGPKIVTVVSWNEWTTAEQYSHEVSKDIEPSNAFGHFYLDLMKEEIARFKGRE